jgi:hypothetical protein
MKQAVRGSTPVARGQDVQGPSRRRLFDYQRLFRVSIRHEYYVRREAGSDVFQALPTRQSTMRMQTLGMVYRADRDGFAVLYDTAQHWNSRERFGGEDAPLSFEVVSTSPHFVSITAMDVDTSPFGTPFRFHNRVPAGHTPVAPANSGRQEARTTPAPTVPLYAELRPALPSAANLIQLSSRFRPIPIGIIDIFLGDGDSPSACPMPPADGGQAPSFVSYDVLFEARRTFWKYHIVPQPGSGAFDNLAIDPSMFLGPFEETLINGEQSYRFLSKEPIALANQSSSRWSLHGRRRERMTRDAVLVERLPAPAVDQLALFTDNERALLGVADGLCSEMFVYV